MGLRSTHFFSIDTIDDADAFPEEIDFCLQV